MPSDARIADILAALEPVAAPFRAAIVAAADELNAFLAAQRAPREERTVREAVRLGGFAAGRIDPGRFAELTGGDAAPDPIRLGRLEQAREVLAAFLASGDDLYRVRVPPGADLHDALRDAFAWRGRVFNAARAFELIRAGAALREPVGNSLDYRAWSRPQRAIAPPLVVELNGADLHVGGIAEYLDGGQKIVLLVEGPAAPAPLARLIAPDTFVVQTEAADDVAQLGDVDGPGVVAIMPAGCARFTHRPRTGTRVWQRITIEHLPDAPAHAVAGGSLRRQLEELAWLRELAEAPADALPSAEPETPEAAPADRLAAWLLKQTDLRED